MDVDVVVDGSVDRLAALAGSLAGTFYYAEPARFGDRMLAALIALDGAGKVDLIVRDPDAWGESAMGRRQRWSHPVLGPIWISSLEDLVLAKLEWSDGTSELQLRDCAALLRVAAGSEDTAYLDRWADRLDLVPLLQQVRGQADAT